MQKFDRYRWRPLLMVVMTVVAGGVILLGVTEVENLLVNRTGHDLQWVAMEIAEKLDLVLFERYGDTKLLADLLSEMGDGPEDTRWTQHLKKIQDAYPIYAWIGVLDKTGRVVAATDPDTVGVSVEGLDQVGQLHAQSDIVVEHIRRDRLVQQHQTVGFSTPFATHPQARNSAPFQGFVTTRLDVLKLDAVVTRILREFKEKTEFQQGMEFQIFDGQGRVVGESLRQPGELANLLALGVQSAKLATQGRAGFVLEDHRRRPTQVLTGYAPLPARAELEGLGWSILVRVDQSEALRPIYSGVQEVIVWGAAVFVPLWGLLLWTTFRLRAEWRQTEVAKQASQEAKDLLQSIFDDASDPHILVDQGGVIREWNSKAEHVFGWSAAEARGLHLSDVTNFLAYQEEASPQDLGKILESGVGQLIGNRFEMSGWHKGGWSFPTELTVTPVKRPHGYVYSVFARDISEEKQKEQAQSVEHRIAEVLLKNPSLQEASQEIVVAICNTLGWRFGVLWKVDEEMGVLRYVGGWQGSPVPQFELFLERSRQCNFSPGVGLPGRVWGRGKVEWISDVSRDGNFPRAAVAKEVGLHAAFAFPVKLESKVQVVFEFFSEAIQQPSQRLLDFIENLSRQLSQLLGRQTAERSLRCSEARFSGILQLAEDAIVSVDDSQRIILFNNGAERIFGYTEGEMLGQSLDLLFPARFRQVHSCHVREFGLCQMSSGPMVGRREVIGLRKSGEEFPAEASIAKVTVEDQTTYTTILRDISVRKQEEWALRESKAHAEQLVTEKKALLATVEAFFVRLTASGVVCEWTTQAEKLFDIPFPEAIGTIFRDLPIDWSWEPISEAIDRVGQTLTVVYLRQVRVDIHGNRERFLKLTLSPLRTDSGVDVVLMGEDVTDHLLLERDLAQAQKLESIGQLAAGIAHEINTPTQFVGDNVRFLSEAFSDVVAVLDRHRILLTSVKAGACAPDLIEQCEAEARRADLDYLTEEVPKAMVQTAEGIERIATIVRAMKEFAHPGSDDKAYVDINRAIGSTVTVSRNEWKYVAELTTDLAPDLPPVYCLLGPFNQMILNMIVNAAHAITDVMSDTGRKGLITIVSRLVGEWVEIRITDTGTGIPEAIREKIFDPFFTTKPVGKGTGQGLAIAHSVVVDKHGGTIDVESEVGKGTTFIVRLPTKAGEENQPMSEAA